MIKTVNRVLLALAGLALLLAGLLILIGGLDLDRRWSLGLPSWWPAATPDQVLLSDRARARWTDRGWWWPVVIAALAALLALSLWWLFAQFRERRLGRIQVPVPRDTNTGPDGAGEPYPEGGARQDGEGETGAAWLRARTLEDALAAETGALDGVDRAKVTLHGRRRTPRARIVLTLAAHAVPAALLERLAAEPLGNARRSASLPALPADIRLRSDRHPASRVE